MSIIIRQVKINDCIFSGINGMKLENNSMRIHKNIQTHGQFMTIEEISLSLNFLILLLSNYANVFIMLALWSLKLFFCFAFYTKVWKTLVLIPLRAENIVGKGDIEKNKNRNKNIYRIEKN